MDIIIQLENKIDSLERKVEYYRSRYLSLHYKFRKYIYKQKIKDKKLREIMSDLLFILTELDTKFSCIDKLREDVESLRDEMYSIKKEMAQVNKKLYQLDETINIRWKKR